MFLKVQNMHCKLFIVIIDGHGVGGWGGAPQGKKLFEVDTQGEKGRHPHLDTPKVKKKLGKLTPGVSTFSHFYLVKSPPGGRAGGKKFGGIKVGGGVNLFHLGCRPQKVFYPGVQIYVCP